MQTASEGVTGTAEKIGRRRVASQKKEGST